MLLPRFEHLRPRELAAAHEMLATFGEDACVYAGGTELLLAMKARVLRYAQLIDLKHVPGLNTIRLEANELVIGACVSHHRIATDPTVRRVLPAYAALSNNVANIRVRAAGTLGGNLCFAEPHADPPALLAAYGATLTLESAKTQRRVAMAEFIESEFTTVRESDEILTEIRIPVPQSGDSYCYMRFGHLTRPAVGIAAGMIRREGTLAYRIWAGAIGGRPVRLAGLEAALAGVTGKDLMEVLPAAAETAGATLDAHDDLHGSADYKRHLAGVLARRAVLSAAGIAAEGSSRHG